MYTTPDFATMKPAARQQALTVLTIAAWMLEAGVPYQQADWLDGADWLAYATFCGAPPAIPARDYGAYSSWFTTGAEWTAGLGWVSWFIDRVPLQLSTAGRQALARHAEAAVITARLNWLAPRLPLANPERSSHWYGSCAIWLATEAELGRACSPAEILPELGKLTVRPSPDRAQAILACLERLRAAAAARFTTGSARRTT